MLAVVDALGGNGQTILFVLAEKNENIQRSAGNLAQVKVLMSGYLNIRDLLGYDLLVFSKDAIEQVEEWLAVPVAEGVVEDVPESDTDVAVEAEELDHAYL